MKTKLTEGIIEDICKKLRAGNYVKVVADSVGISQRTFYLWLERGSKAEKLYELRKKVPETERLFFQFFQSVRH
jgi:hypothetical protein